MAPEVQKMAQGTIASQVNSAGGDCNPEHVGDLRHKQG